MTAQMLAHCIVSGVTYGSVYGLFAMAIVILYRTNHIFNFALTEISTFCVIIMYFLLRHMGYFPAFGLALLFSFLLGCGLHLSVLRIATERKQFLTSSIVVITIGLSFLFNAMSNFELGDEPVRFPSPINSEQTFSILGIAVQSDQIVILLLALLSIGAVRFFFARTKMGLVLEAIAENTDAARLRGVRASNFLALSWGITSLMGTFVGAILAPLFYLYPAMLMNMMSYSLIAVVIGGLESPFGALVGGVIVGCVESFAGEIPFVGSDLKFIAVLGVLVLTLIVRPRGLWGRAEQRRV